MTTYKDIHANFDQILEVHKREDLMSLSILRGFRWDIARETH